jgi:DNA-directed RNA polymerase subunit L
MFSFLKKIFGSTNDKTEHELISTLKNDHKNLIKLYKNVEDYLQKDDFVSTKKELKKFVSLYNRHILLEDTQLYISLEEKYKEQKQILKTIKSISKDMNSITRAITFFEKKYPSINSENKEMFLEEFREIGKILLDRVDLEEERLYTLL